METRRRWQPSTHLKTTAAAVYNMLLYNTLGVSLLPSIKRLKLTRGRSNAYVDTYKTNRKLIYVPAGIRRVCDWPTMAVVPGADLDRILSRDRGGKWVIRFYILARRKYVIYNLYLIYIYIHMRMYLPMVYIYIYRLYIRW